MQTIIVRIISDYNCDSVENWLKQQSKNSDSCFYFQNLCIYFTTQAIPCDYCLLINKVDKNTLVECPKDRIWGLQQEPYIPAHKKHGIPFKNEFAKKQQTYAQCSKVFAFVQELLTQNTKFIPSPPFIYWLIESGWDRKMSFDNLYSLDIHQKTQEISCIANTDKKAFSGHIQRTKFVQFLKTTSLPIQFFGGEKKHNFLKSKLDALWDFKYSIAIENSSTPYYFSEKITDCFIAGCMPIYYGAPNIADFFPQESFIQIDIHQPQEAYEKINEAIQSKMWEKHLDAIIEAKHLCMTKYNLVENLGEKIAKDFLQKPSQKKEIIIVKGYKRSIQDHILRNLQRIYFKICKILNFF